MKGRPTDLSLTSNRYARFKISIAQSRHQTLINETGLKSRSRSSLQNFAGGDDSEICIRCASNKSVMLQLHPWSKQHHGIPECHETDSTSSIYVTLLCETDELILGLILLDAPGQTFHVFYRWSSRDGETVSNLALAQPLFPPPVLCSSPELLLHIGEPCFFRNRKCLG